MGGVEDLFRVQQKKLLAALDVPREAICHSGAKGVASEREWTHLLCDHLPSRYQVCKGFVLDCEGEKSEEIDIIVYDNQYTPVLLNREEQRFVPAESVYAVIEVKQLLDRRYMDAAGKKAASVRRLKRTSATIHHAGGKHEPRDPFRILAGILAYESDWKPAFGDPLKKVLESLPEDHRIDLVAPCGTGPSTWFMEAAKARSKLGAAGRRRRWLISSSISWLGFRSLGRLRRSPIRRT